jgi:hypothetical protein
LKGEAINSNIALVDINLSANNFNENCIENFWNAIMSNSNLVRYDIVRYDIVRYDIDCSKV